MKTSLMSVIDKLAPFKTKRVKGNLQEQFDGKVLESIALRDKFTIKHATNHKGWFCKKKRVTRKQIKGKYCYTKGTLENT